MQSTTSTAKLHHRNLEKTDFRRDPQATDQLKKPAIPNGVVDCMHPLTVSVDKTVNRSHDSEVFPIPPLPNYAPPLTIPILRKRHDKHFMSEPTPKRLPELIQSPRVVLMSTVIDSMDIEGNRYNKLQHLNEITNVNLYL